MEHEKSNLFFAPMDKVEGKLIRFMVAWTRKISNLPLDISEEEREVRNKCLASVLAIIWKRASEKAVDRVAAEDAFKCIVICLLSKEHIGCLDRKLFDEDFAEAASIGFDIIESWMACTDKTGHHTLRCQINGFEVNAEEIIEDCATITLAELNILATYIRGLERAGQSDSRVEFFDRAVIGEDAYAIAGAVRNLTMSYEGRTLRGCLPLTDDAAGLHILTAAQFDEFCMNEHGGHHLYSDAKRPKAWAMYSQQE